MRDRWPLFGEDICLVQNGIPPKDLLEEVAAALIAAGISVDEFFETACTVTGDWKYDQSKSRLKDRIDQKYNHERSVPLKFRTLSECLNPRQTHTWFSNACSTG